VEADLVNGGLRQAAVDELADPAAIIARADAFIDSHLRGRYALPLSSTPLEIKDSSVRISMWYALQSLGWDPEAGPDESIKSGYQDTVKWLEKLACGKVSLDILADATDAVHEGGPIVRSIVRNLGIRNDGRI